LQDSDYDSVGGPTDKRFNTAGFVAMTIDRDATVSKMNARRTTVRISHAL